MEIFTVDGLAIESVASCLPDAEIDNFDDCKRFFGPNTENTVRTTGILKRRIAAPGETSASLCIRAAREALERAGAAPGEIGAVVSLTFTPAMGLPGNAFIAQTELGLPGNAIALDLHQACAGYPFALYTAGLIAANTRKKVLLLDGDVQSAVIDKDDRDLVPVLSDAGTATVVSHNPAAGRAHFAFMADGAGRDILGMAGRAAPLKMDGFGVFRFVAGEVVRFLKDFQTAAGRADYFVPHQANMYLVRQLAKELGYAGRTAQTGEIYGNSSSSTVPVGLAGWLQTRSAPGSVLLAGFGAGLAAAAARIEIA